MATNFIGQTAWAQIASEHFQLNYIKLQLYLFDYLNFITCQLVKNGGSVYFSARLLEDNNIIEAEQTSMKQLFLLEHNYFWHNLKMWFLTWTPHALGSHLYWNIFLHHWLACP